MVVFPVFLLTPICQPHVWLEAIPGSPGSPAGGGQHGGIYSCKQHWAPPMGTKEKIQSSTQLPWVKACRKERGCSVVAKCRSTVGLQGGHQGLL